MQVDDPKVLEGLINLPATLFIYTAWMVPAAIKKEVEQIVEQAENCIGNTVLTLLPEQEQGAKQQLSVEQ